VSALRESSLLLLLLLGIVSGTQMYVTMTSFLKQHVSTLFSVAVEQSTGTIDVMRSELNNLQSITSEGMSKMMRSRSRHEAREG